MVTMETVPFLPLLRSICDCTSLAGARLNGRQQPAAFVPLQLPLQELQEPQRHSWTLGCFRRAHVTATSPAWWMTGIPSHGLDSINTNHSLFMRGLFFLSLDLDVCRCGFSRRPQSYESSVSFFSLHSQSSLLTGPGRSAWLFSPLLFSSLFDPGRQGAIARLAIW